MDNNNNENQNINHKIVDEEIISYKLPASDANYECIKGNLNNYFIDNTNKLN